jgi:hypothetical protein
LMWGVGAFEARFVVIHRRFLDQGDAGWARR